jgi:hypothetical protein
MGSTTTMPTDFVLLCVVIFVTSASTFCCQIFGGMCAKKVLASKAKDQIMPDGPNQSVNQVRRRREGTWSSSSGSLDYGSSTTSEDIVDDRRYRERKTSHQRRYKSDQLLYFLGALTGPNVEVFVPTGAGCTNNVPATLTRDRGHVV